MIWVGLTGPIACGKSTVAKILEADFGVKVINADQIAKQALDPVHGLLDSVIREFGSTIISPGGELDRRQLGRIVFADRAKKVWLEQLIHPFVQNHVEKLKTQYQNEGRLVVFYDVPLLFENHLESQFDSILLVACDQTTQIKRAVSRDQINQKDVEDRIANQLSLNHKLRKSHYVIWNNLNQDLLSLETQVKQYWSWLTAKHMG